MLDIFEFEKLVWYHKTEMKDGIKLAYDDFLHNDVRAER